MTQLTRLETITELLRTRQEVLFQAQDETPGHSFDSRCLELPTAYHEGSYREAEDAMRRLRELERTLWWHVHQRYECCWRRTVNVRVRRTGKHHRYEILGLTPSQEPLRDAGLTGTQDLSNGDGPLYRVVIDEWHPNVQRPLVTQGVQWLSNNWHGRPPQLPQDILRTLAA